MGVLGGHWGFLTRDMEDMVIPDIMNDVFLPQGRYPENFVLISQLEGQEGGSRRGRTWRTLRVPDRRHGGLGHSWHHEWCLFSPRKIPRKFYVDISIGSVSGRGGQEGGYLEDVEGSWPETWRTGSSLTTWMTLGDPKDLILKVLSLSLFLAEIYKFVVFVKNVTDIRQTTYIHTYTAEI